MRNLECIWDNILVKSELVNKHVKDLEEVFKVIRKFGMRSNSNKYVFRI